jgi:hypothetical protein
MDVKTTFLHGVLEENICMEKPEDFVTPGSPRRVCKLLKCLYGLKQALRVWYQTLTAFLDELAFRRLIKDRCVFTGRIDGETCYIAVYVDDLFIIAPTTALVTRIKVSLIRRFHISDLGQAHFLLGWSISRDRTRRTIHLHQRKYAYTVLDKFSELVSYPASTPCERGTKLMADMQRKTEEDCHEMPSFPAGQSWEA